MDELRPSGWRPRPLLLFAVLAALGLFAAANASYFRQLSRFERGVPEVKMAGAIPQSIELQLNRLRTDLDLEASRELSPAHWRSISFPFDYWADVGLGFRETKWGPVAKQLKIVDTIPPPATTVHKSRRDVDHIPFKPLTWYEKVSNLKGASELNATSVTRQPNKEISLATDVFFADGCVRLIAVPECHWILNWNYVTIAIHGAWKESACTPDGKDGLSCPPEARSFKSDGPLPLSRVRTRTVNEWGVIAEFCSKRLVTEHTVDVEYYGWGVSRRFQLTRVDTQRRPAEELAMSVMFFNSASLMPLWLQSWRALGVGRFYLYVKGKVADLDEEDARIPAQFRGDPGVTLIEWDLPFAQEGGVYMVEGKCTGHYSQILSFNHAYERYKRRHLYMGFYDPDEYGLLDASLLESAWSQGANPMLMLLGRYGFPPVFALPNRFGAIIEPDFKHSLTLTSALSRKWYARDETEEERSKSWVRTMNMREDINIGNHNAFEMVDFSVHPKWGTVYMSGSGYETLHLRQAIYAAPEDGSFLHVLNFKEHSSKLPFVREEEIAKMVEGKNFSKEAVMIFQRASDMCQACVLDKAKYNGSSYFAHPGCGYPC